jgi:hypothetical protein
MQVQIEKQKKALLDGSNLDLFGDSYFVNKTKIQTIKKFKDPILDEQKAKKER